MSQIPERGLENNKMSVSTTLFHPRQPGKGAQCVKYLTRPLSSNSKHLNVYNLSTLDSFSSHFNRGTNVLEAVVFVYNPPPLDLVSKTCTE